MRLFSGRWGLNVVRSSCARRDDVRPTVTAWRGDHQGVHRFAGRRRGSRRIDLGAYLAETDAAVRLERLPDAADEVRPWVLTGPTARQAMGAEG